MSDGSTDGRLSLDEAVQSIKSKAERSDELEIEAALEMRDLKRRIQAGEAGPDVKWWEWAMTSFGRGETWVRRLQRIGEADDPRAMLAWFQRKEHEASGKFLTRQAAMERAMEPERRAMQRWVREASLDDVKLFYTQIQRREKAREFMRVTGRAA